jgi:hypothetical protein
MASTFFEMASSEPKGAVSELLARQRLTIVLVILLIEIGIFFAGLLTPISISTQQDLSNATNTQFGPFASASPAQLVVLIFTHNLAIALAEMIPVLGAVLFGISVYSTGLAAQALAVSIGLPSQGGAIIFAFPYTLVELSAYAVAVGAGVMLMVSWRRRRLRSEIKVFGLEILEVVAILFIAAAMETTTTRISFLLGFALWLPTVLSFAWLVNLTRRNLA